MYYKITLTASGGLGDTQIGAFRKYFEPCKHAYLVNEFGESKMNSHLEGIVEFDTEKTSNVTDRIKLVYKKLEIEVIPKVTFRVKRVSHLIGALIYVSKELRESGKVVLLKGWESSWIDQQIKDNVKSIPYKMLIKKGTRVSQNTGGAIVYEWCIAHNMQVTNKEELFKVVKLMGDEGFLFGSIRPLGIYQDVCALFGDGVATEECFRSALCFLSRDVINC